MADIPDGRVRRVCMDCERQPRGKDEIARYRGLSAGRQTCWVFARNTSQLAPRPPGQRGLAKPAHGCASRYFSKRLPGALQARRKAF